MGTTYDTAGSPQTASHWTKGLLTGVVLTILLGGLIVWLTTGVGLLRLLRSYSSGSMFPIDQVTVVKQIQQLQRLETVSFSMDKIIAGERDSPYLPKFLVSDRLLLVVHGEVIGGVDLSKLQPRDVSVRGRTVTVHLPSPEILVTRVDNA